MANQTLASSASLHHRLGAFSVLFTALAVTFNPLLAFALTMLATYFLSKV